jgi:FkbM family methyltransferase
MRTKIAKKIHTLRNLNWVWFVKYNKKRASVNFYFYRSKIKGEDHLNINIDGLKLKMSFLHPYYHMFARRLQEGKHESNTLIAWKRQSEVGPQVVLDIGGYVGTYGLISAIANPESQVFIFEPDATNFKQIEENIKLNGLKNASVVQMAVSDVVGKIFFNNIPGGEGGSIANNNTGSSSIDCTTIDAWTEKIGSMPTLIKLDVEGAEFRSLTGGLALLQKSSKLRILLEVHYNLLKKFGDTQEKLWQLLKECGYDNFYLDTTEWNDHYWIYKSADKTST